MKKKVTCKEVDCNLCAFADASPMVFRRFKKGTHFPAEKRIQNCIIFVQKGELLINSAEYPGTILKSMDMVLQGIGSKLELLALTDVEYYIYWFTELNDLICKEQYEHILKNSKEPLVYSPLKANPQINHLFADITTCITKLGSPCNRYLEMKGRELIFLLTNLYPLQQISSFFYPISIYTESFYYFVMQNYEKVKNVEEFAHIGGYSTSTFRRLFKNMFHVPAYEWILDKKREGILADLRRGDERLSVICERYGFETPSHFAHFCKSSFGDTPRSLRKRLQEGEETACGKEKELRMKLKRNAPKN